MFHIRTFLLASLLFCVLSFPIKGLCQEIEFDKPIDFSGYARVPVVFSGSAVYVTWVTGNITQGWTLNLAYSSDAGMSFRVNAIHSSRYADVYAPIMVENKDAAYIAFPQGPCAPSSLYFCRVNADGGSACRPLYSRLIGLEDIRLAAVDNKVYIAWRDWAMDFDVHLMYSTDYGATFSNPINLTNDPGVRRFVSGLTATENEVYVRWTADNQSFLIHGAMVESDFKILSR